MLGFGAEQGMREITKGTETIVDRHQHHTALRQRGPVVSRLGAVTSGQSTAMNPNHHGTMIGWLRGTPYVEIEAVLDHLINDLAVERTLLPERLQAGAAEVCGVAD